MIDCLKPGSGEAAFATIFQVEVCESHVYLSTGRVYIETPVRNVGLAGAGKSFQD